MKTRLVLLSFLLLPASSWASTYRCQLSQDCFFCVPGTKLDDCSVTCSYCLGIKCLGAASHGLELGFEVAEAEPLQKLHRFPAEPFGVALGAPVTQVIEALWHWYDSPITLKRDVLDLAGAIKVNGKAQEFSLEIRQGGDQQVYTLRLDGAPETTWTVSSLSDAEILVEFTVAKSQSDPGRSGQFKVEKPTGPR